MVDPLVLALLAVRLVADFMTKFHLEPTAGCPLEPKRRFVDMQMYMHMHMHIRIYIHVHIYIYMCAYRG